MSKKTITIGLIVMIIINIGLITLVLTKNGRPDRRDGPPTHMLVKELGFNEAQTLQFDQLKEDHFTFVQPKMERIGELKRTLMNTLDRTKAKNLTFEIGKLEGEIDYLTFEHFAKVREICDDQQKQKMDEIKKRISQRMTEMHHRMRGDRPRH